MIKRTHMVDENGERFRYQVRLVIKHPSIDPNSITKRLGLVPRVSWLAGSTRESPAGTPLPGVHEASMWGYSIRTNGRKFFYDDVARVIDALEPHGEFLSRIVATDGTIDLIVHLPGDINMGDVLPWRDLGRLAALKVSLGIEVFPNFN